MKETLNKVECATIPLVSVVIPTYNRAHVIARTIENVLRQTYKNFEVIVVDDGSLDDTRSKLALFGDKIRVIHQINAGAAAARNRGLREAKGEIVAFQDSDDEWHPTKIARQVDLLIKLGPSVPCCVTNAVFRCGNGIPSERRTFDIAKLQPSCGEGLWLNPAQVLATRPLFFNQVVAARRGALIQVGGFRPGLKYLEDWDLALKLSLLGPWGFIAEPLTYWNPGSEGSFTARAESESGKLHQCADQVLSGAITMALVRGDFTTVRYLKRTLKGHRRILFALRIQQRRFPGVRLIGSAVLFAERSRSALLRRTGGLPAMLVGCTGDFLV